VTGPGALDKSEEVIAGLEALRSRLSDEDRGTIEDVQTFIADVKKLVTTMDGQLAAMRWLAQKQFRPKTDKVPEGQLALDLLGFMLAQRGEPASGGDEQPSGPTPDVPKAPPRDKRTGKMHLIPVVPVRKELSEAERTCGHCNVVKTEFDVEPRRTLMYEPSKLYFREEQLVKYACRCCGLGVTTAPASPKLIEGSNVGASILAHLVVAKVIDATPIERVGKQWARHGYDVASSTMHDWFGRSASEVKFLGPIAQDELLRSSASTIRRCRRRSWDTLTERSAGACGCTWATSRVSPTARSLRTGRAATLAACSKASRGTCSRTGTAGSTRFFAGGDGPNKVGCNDHCRRKYVEALKLGDRRAARVVALYGELYAVERETKDLAADERLLLRRARSVPLWAQLTEEVARLEPVADPKSPLGKANTYFRRQNAALSAFLEHGVLPISNAHVERLLRGVALFRKNSLFVGSLEAGQRYAALLTLAVNCALCGANPFDYFTGLFDRLAAGWPNARAAELMPQAWLAAQQQAEQVEGDGAIGGDHG
jgi:transposase